MTINAGADVDLFLYEPDGSLSAPRLGTVSSNGYFTGDSRDLGTYYEGWGSRRIVQAGTYYVSAYRSTAPTSSTVSTYVAVRYRTGFSDNYTSLYGAGP